MRSQESVSLLLGEDFDHAVSVGDGFGPRISQEGESALAVLDFLIRKHLLLAMSSSSV